MASEPEKPRKRKAPTPKGRAMPLDADTSFESPLEETIGVPFEALAEGAEGVTAPVDIAGAATAETSQPSVNVGPSEEWTFWQATLAYGLGLIIVGGLHADVIKGQQLHEAGAALLYASTLRSLQPTSGGPYFATTRPSDSHNLAALTGFALSAVVSTQIDRNTFRSWFDDLAVREVPNVDLSSQTIDLCKFVDALTDVSNNSGVPSFGVAPVDPEVVSRLSSSPLFLHFSTRIRYRSTGNDVDHTIRSEQVLPHEPAFFSPEGRLNWPLIEEIGKRWFTEGGVPQLRIDHDLALDDPSKDQLGFDVYANAIAALIQLPETGTPLTLAINAPWGSGKSSLANMIKARLKERRQGIFFCDFNAWLHDEASNLGAAFTAAVVRTAASERMWWRRFLQPLPWKAAAPTERSGSMRRITLLSLLGTGGLFAADWFGQIPLDMNPFYLWLETMMGKQGAVIGTGASGVAAAIALVAGWQKAVEPIWKSLTGLIADPKAAAATGSLADTRQRFAELVKHATRGGKRRMVIFIDDIERCQPPRSLEICETINQLVGHPGVVVVMLGDMQAVEACAAIKYKDLAEIYNPALQGQKLDGVAKQTAYGRHYLQKIIQLQFDLPPHRPQRIDSMMERQVEAANEPLPALQKKLVLQTRFGTVPVEPWLESLLSSFGASSLASDIVGHLFASKRELQPVEVLLRVRRRLVRIRSIVAIVILTALTTALFLVVGGFRNDLGQAMLGVALGSAVLPLPFISGAIQAYDRLIAKKEAERAAQSASSTALDDESLDAAVQGAGPDVSKEAVKSALRIQLSDQLIGGNELLLDAHRAALDFLPPTPRNAKRLLNSLRLSLFILRARNLLPSADLTPRHIGKWAALKERWPFLAQIIIRNPGVVAKLEDCPRDVRAHRIAKTCPELSGDSKFGDFLEQEPKLAGVIERLVYFYEENAPQPSGSSPNGQVQKEL